MSQSNVILLIFIWLVTANILAGFYMHKNFEGNGHNSYIGRFSIHRPIRIAMQRDPIIPLKPIISSMLTVSCTSASPLLAAPLTPADESIQLLYGYHTNIPDIVTWGVLLYGFYTFYFWVYRVAASW